jgi:hypothetical protein
MWGLDPYGMGGSGSMKGGLGLGIAGAATVLSLAGCASTTWAFGPGLFPRITGQRSSPDSVPVPLYQPRKRETLPLLSQMEVGVRVPCDFRVDSLDIMIFRAQQGGQQGALVGADVPMQIQREELGLLMKEMTKRKFEKEVQARQQEQRQARLGLGGRKVLSRLRRAPRPPPRDYVVRTPHGPTRFRYYPADDWMTLPCESWVEQTWAFRSLPAIIRWPLQLLRPLYAPLWTVRWLSVEARQWYRFALGLRGLWAPVSWGALERQAIWALYFLTVVFVFLGPAEEAAFAVLDAVAKLLTRGKHTFPKLKVDVLETPITLHRFALGKPL